MTTPTTPTVDVTADLLGRCAVAKLSAAEANEIVAAAAGDLNKGRDLIIDKLAARDTSPRIQLGADAGGDEQGHAKALGEAITAKLKGVPATGPFGGMSTAQLAAEWLRAHNVRTDRHDAVSVVTRAMTVRMEAGYHSTSDFPHLLGDQMHKQLSALYAAADVGIGQIAGSGTMPDFRSKKYVKMSSFPEFAAIPEGAEFTWGQLQESGETISVGVYGKAISVTLQALVNDSLDGINRSLRDVAFAAANMKAGLLLTALLDTQMSDGKVLFHADHANVIDDGDQPNVTQVSAARAKMRLQKALDGTTPLGLTPAIMLVPAALETKAEILATAINASEPDNVSVFANKVRVAVEPRLDAINDAAWYVFNDPATLPAVLWNTLDLTPTPRLEIEDGITGNFATLGTSYRVWQAAGAAPVEFRAAVRNSGVDT